MSQVPGSASSSRIEPSAASLVLEMLPGCFLQLILG